MKPHLETTLIGNLYKRLTTQILLQPILRQKKTQVKMVPVMQIKIVKMSKGTLKMRTHKV